MATRSDAVVASDVQAAERALQGYPQGRLRILPFLGPAFVACVAYIDPGNFATNIAGGSKFGFTLVWVIVASNLMAMLIQTLSAKLGIATGRNLPEICRERFSRRTSIGLWLQAEVIAMATDLAEFLGAALGFHLLFGTPLFLAGLVTGVIVFGFAFQVFLAKPDAAGVAQGLFTPKFSDSESVLLAAGILGATVMPH